jgi:hypothetical protein
LVRSYEGLPVTTDLPWFVRVGLAFVLVGLLATTLVLSFIENDAGTRNLVVGAILGYVAAVVQYYFGSSEGSRKKDETISTATAALATSTPGAGQTTTTTTTETAAGATTTTTAPAEPRTGSP